MLAGDRIGEWPQTGQWRDAIGISDMIRNAVQCPLSEWRGAVCPA
jgi:hypothetical protein